MRLLVFILFLVATRGTTMDTVIVDKKYPVIKFVEEHIVAGDIVEGEKFTFTISFSNIGDADLIIKLVNSCKCTSIEWPKRRIRPGESGEIYVSFDSAGYYGEIKKTIDIISNEKAGFVQVNFKANVLKR